MVLSTTFARVLPVASPAALLVVGSRYQICTSLSERVHLRVHLALEEHPVRLRIARGVFEVLKGPVPGRDGTRGYRVRVVTSEASVEGWIYLEEGSHLERVATRMLPRPSLRLVEGGCS